MNNPPPTAKRTIEDARNLIKGTSRSEQAFPSEIVKKEFVRLGDFIFRPTEIDWFFLTPGTEAEDGKLPDRTIVYCKGQCASLEDEDHQLFDFLTQYFKPQPMKL